MMEFESPKLGEDEWEKRQPKFQSFFGPGIEAVLEKTDKGMDVALVREGK